VQVTGGSGADEAGVKGASERGVGGSLDDGAAVGEERDGVGRAVEAEEKIVEANLAVWAEAVAHGGEVYGTVMLVDLDGVAPAEGDVGAVFAGEVSEDALAADSAPRAGISGTDLTAIKVSTSCWRPEIEGEKGAAHEVRLAGKELESFSDLDGGGQVDGGGENA
jgi:hypothetical protein